MSPVPCTPFVKKIISNCQLGSRGEKIVKRCVSRYSTPHTFSQTLAYMTYRMINAIFFIFNQSDWQLAQKVIRADFKKKVIFTGTIYSKMANKKVDQLHKSTINKLAVPVSKMAVRGLISLNDKTKTASQVIAPIRYKINLTKQEFMDKVDGMDLNGQRLSSIGFAETVEPFSKTAFFCEGFGLCCKLPV